MNAAPPRIPRRLVPLLAAAALALGAAPAWAAPGNPAAKGPKEHGKTNASTQKADVAAQPTSGSGIIQAIRGRVLLVRELDGRVLHVRIGPRTAVFVDGVRTGVGKLKPGFVVSFSGAAGNAAGELRASDPSPASRRGIVVQSVGPQAVVLTRPNGATLAIAVGPATRIFLNGRPAALADIRAGDGLAKATGAGKRAAKALRFRRPG